MRRVIAAFLLACLGMIIPLAGSPVRFCVLDHKVLIQGSGTCSKESKKKSCCPDCREKKSEGDPCCLEVDHLPDATPPASPDSVPPALVMDLPEPMFMAPVMAPVVEHVFTAATPIRGPDTPTAHRALLGIWRL